MVSIASHFGSFEEGLRIANTEKQEKNKDINSSSEEFPHNGGLLDDIERIYSEKGGVPSKKDIKNSDRYSISDYEEVFASLNEALEASDIDYKKELLDEIERVWKLIGGKPTKSDMKKHSKYDLPTYSDYFGTWRKAKRKADVDEEIEDMLEDLRRLHSEKGMFPKAGDITSQGEYAVSDYTEEFGSLDEALETAGIYKGEEILGEVERVCKKLGKKSSSAEFSRHSDLSRSMVSSYFGSWSEAIEQIDDEIVEGIQPYRERLLEEIEDIATEVDGIPSPQEVEEIGEYSPAEYEMEFGSIKNALEASDISYDNLLKEKLVDKLETVSDELDSVLQSSS
jgi:hypothetical protein